MGTDDRVSGHGNVDLATTSCMLPCKPNHSARSANVSIWQNESPGGVRWGVVGWGPLWVDHSSAQKATFQQKQEPLSLLVLVSSPVFLAHMVFTSSA